MRSSPSSGSEPAKHGVPVVAFVALALLTQFVVAFPGREPYPSIVMPGFAGISRLKDDPRFVQVAFLRIESGGRTELLAREQLFESAPPGQRSRMMERLNEMSGTVDEWAFIDETAARLGIESKVDSVAVVRRDGFGEEWVVNRIERLP